MEILIGLLILLLIGIVILYSKFDTMKAYYHYADKEWKREEKKAQVEEDLRKQLEGKLSKIAYLNPLTHIGNLDYFLEFGEKRIKENPDKEYTVVVLSISNIAEINRVFGTREADKVLFFVAQTIKKFSNKYLYAHLQSNLFGILIESSASFEIQKFISDLINQITSFEDNIIINPTCGICRRELSRLSLMDLVNNASLAQKSLKHSEKETFKYYTKELEAKFIENRLMSEEMEAAMEQHKFIMYLQPIIDLKTYQIVGSEALVRWDYPGKGLLSPYAFLPIFESNFLVIKLDYYMWEECCKCIRRWIDNKIAPIPVNVNISPIHLQDAKFITVLNQLTEKYLIDKNLLVLELPERAFGVDIETVSQTVQKLSQEGYRLCIDNFGSETTPISLLRKLPVSLVKFDRKFLNENLTNKNGDTILKYLIAMAKELEFDVIAEGVENLAEIDFLAEAGADYAQGYFFSKPIDLRTFDALKKSMVNKVVPADEYFPSYEEMKNDFDLLETLLLQKEQGA